MPELNRDGVAIHYEDDGSGPPILLTHGFGASTGMWAPQVERFASEYRLVRWDMRGHGASDHPQALEHYSQAASIADMLALLDHLRIEQAVIAGHSLGGYLSLAFHARHPERCRALILQGCGPGYRSEASREKWNERAESRARSIEQGGLDALGGGAEVKVSLQRSAHGLAQAARGILSQVDSVAIDSLPNIKVPVLIIIGDGDTHYLQGSAYMAERIPNARNVVVPGAGHGVNIEQPEVVNQAMAEFLAGL
ncbi:MAG: alpha/beta hydrolase [Gammaproteobacteria bacterium]|nr:alpha/beta hydrolase [Gammaproteobacteria bacterium]